MGESPEEVETMNWGERKIELSSLHTFSGSSARRELQIGSPPGLRILTVGTPLLRGAVKG